MEIYKNYTREDIKSLQGIDFFNLINEMLANGWTLSKMDKARVMTKKAIRERMRKYNAYYDKDSNQYVVQDGYTIPKMDTKELQKVSSAVKNNLIETDTSRDTKSKEDTYKSDTNIQFKDLELAVQNLTQEIIKLNTNGIKVQSPMKSPLDDALDLPGEFVPKRFSKDDILINRNHRFHQSVLERLKLFCEDHNEYSLQTIINTLLSEALDKYDR